MRVVGVVDKETIERARQVGFNIEGGHINSKDGRVRIVVKGLFPGTHKTRLGTALRSRVVWWLNTGEALVGCEFNIHHKNHDRSDDRFCNLERLTHSEHAQMHNDPRKRRIECICMHCQQPFTINRWRLKDPTRGRFCTPKCYYAHKRSRNHKKAVSVYAEECR